MQERQFESLIASTEGTGLSKYFKKREAVKQKVASIANKNKIALSGIDLPDECRIPSEQELVQFYNWAIAYKKANKRASKREVRKAVQEHFHIKIYK